MGLRNRPTPKQFIVLGECPAPNQIRNSGRVGAMDPLSDNLEIETPEALDDGKLKNHFTLGR
jgi:hypothetical protein